MLRIDPRSSAPPYEQLRTQVIDQIGSGELTPGARLPSVRRLAADLGLAANTVARAYRELESEGYVRTAGRNGTVVAPRQETPEVVREAVALTAEHVSRMHALGLDGEAMGRYLRRVLESR